MSKSLKTLQGMLDDQSPILSDDILDTAIAYFQELLQDMERGQDVALNLQVISSFCQTKLRKPLLRGDERITTLCSLKLKAYFTAVCFDPEKNLSAFHAEIRDLQTSGNLDLLASALMDLIQGTKPETLALATYLAEAYGLPCLTFLKGRYDPNLVKRYQEIYPMPSGAEQKPLQLGVMLQQVAKLRHLGGSLSPELITIFKLVMLMPNNAERLNTAASATLSTLLRELYSVTELYKLGKMHAKSDLGKCFISALLLRVAIFHYHETEEEVCHRMAMAIILDSHYKDLDLHRRQLFLKLLSKEQERVPIVAAGQLLPNMVSAYQQAYLNTLLRLGRIDPLVCSFVISDYCEFFADNPEMTPLTELTEILQLRLQTCSADVLGEVLQNMRPKAMTVVFRLWPQERAVPVSDVLERLSQEQQKVFLLFCKENNLKVHTSEANNENRLHPEANPKALRPRVSSFSLLRNKSEEPDPSLEEDLTFVAGSEPPGYEGP